MRVVEDALRVANRVFYCDDGGFAIEAEHAIKRTDLRLV